ncbi:MAG: Smr/MutS family protein [Gammaproteobacteria bacterium]|jgi:DNA-nicking Smr family endonuclease
MNDDSEQDNEDDDDLFRQAMKGVAPLKVDNRIRHKPPLRKPPGHHPGCEPAETSERFTAGMYEEQCPENLYFERAGGAQKSVIRKLRGGKLTADAILDLHGLTVEQARLQLADFLQECRQYGYRHVIIIHGKGFRSQSRPVIKPMVNRWLRQAYEVLAFCSARPKDGGTGAVYVLLRRSRD